MTSAPSLSRLWFLVLLLGSAGFAQETTSPSQSPSAFQAAIAGADRIGSGDLIAYRTNDKTMLGIGESLMGSLAMWYAEAARFPPGAVSFNAIGTTVIRLERHGNRLLIRDLAPSLAKRAGESPAGEVQRPVSDPEFSPIALAVEAAAVGPIIVQLPIVAEENNRILVDITAAFSNDFDALTAIPHILSAGVVPMPTPLTVDTSRSYISDVHLYPDNLHIRSHLTFRAMDPNAPQTGPHPVSIEVGHSLVLLPETPMQTRRFDDRVGVFFGEFAEFETAAGEVTRTTRFVSRFRLEKADRNAAVSEPVEPIVFYIGQGVPERWRHYVARGVESWQPVFEAAGFRNAIVARQAPSPAEDPDWNPEDARLNVIRWVPQAMTNAMGPRVVDPRTGEILFAHILVWPDVIRFFSEYYYLMANGLDPDVTGLPLSEEKQGEVLAYAVAHEVGHSIGLRHNHLASTAHTVAELRDPAFANKNGPNASIMAYGRLNYVAQPGDGVTRVLAAQGPADYFAIDWAYGVHTQAELDRMAAEASTDRFRRWAAGEIASEAAWMFDPRVLKENVGSERIEATRLGLATLRRSVESLDGAVGDDDATFRSVYNLAMGRQDLMIDSVLKLVGGHYVGEGEGSRPAIVPAGDQRAAVSFLLYEAAQSFDVYLEPDALLRADPIGGNLVVRAHQGRIVTELLSGEKLAVLESQSAMAPDAYDVAALAEDVTNAIWEGLEGQPRWRKALQIAYLDRVEKMLTGAADPAAVAGARALQGSGYSQGFVATALATGADTVFPAFARETLPELKKRCEDVASEEDDTSTRLHLIEMAHRIEVILNADANER